MPTILLVDDDVSLRVSLGRILSRAGHTCVEAETTEGALRLLEDYPEIELILLDIQLGEESGLDLLAVIHADFPDIAVVMTTGIDDPAVAEVAFEIGAYGYLIKAFTPNEALIAVASALRRRRLELANRQRPLDLTNGMSRFRSVRAVISGIEDGIDLRQGPDPLVAWLSRAIALRDEETGRHLERMSRYAAILAHALDLGPATVEWMQVAAALHDVGKIGIPDAILLKPGALTPEEQSIMRRHSVLGYQLLAESPSPAVQLAATVALGHHERWDGFGYPSGLAHEEIPVAARIAAVADVFDALTSDRVYRPALPVDDAVAYVAEQAGQQFCPRVVGAFLGALERVVAVRDEYPDIDEQARIRVMIVDDHEVFVQSLVRLIGSVADMRVVGVAGSVAAAVDAAGRYQPDVVLMDLELPDGDGASATRAIRSLVPATKVVMLTGRTDRQAVASAVSAGCAGYVPKTESADRVVQMVRAVQTGDESIPAEEMPDLLKSLRPSATGLGADLRPREIEVLELMAVGLSNRVIADRLHMGLNTVGNHVQSILGKLDAHSKLEAVAVAVREGVIGRSEPVAGS
ncbi:MAG TPA: response regulator [Acidimicrobiales bacterium]|jgi:putative two-component system response regulator|nr:response regulator [Acidimicrobiales bacterium]